MRRKERNKGKRKKGTAHKRQLRQELYQFFEESSDVAFAPQRIAHKLKVRKKELLQDMLRRLDRMVEKGVIEQLSDGRYKSLITPVEVSGKVDHVNPRYAFVIPDDEDQPDIHVSSRDLKTAVHGDKVLVKVRGGRAGKPEGIVSKVTQRARARYAGRIEMSRNFAFVIPDYKRLYQDFFIRTEDLGNAKNNDKVVFEVTQWAAGDSSPEAKVVEVLGKTGENEAEIHSIMIEFGLPLRFSNKVLTEADQAPQGIPPEEIAKRKDFRKVLTFTIDPADAKDFDDALSFRPLENGHVEVGIHIADVTHYVQPDTLLDQEAYERCTSVYLVDRTIPMLPERLSNELCSLNPKEDKLTFSAVFELDTQAKVQAAWYGRTVIHSDHRFTYEEAQQGLEEKTGPYANELIQLNTLAKVLRTLRFQNGAVNFETAEVRFQLDDKGTPIAVVPKVRKDAHKLVEEFMLLANKSVATFVHNQQKGSVKNTFVYRTHDDPDPEKVADFSTFAKQFGHKVSPDTKTLSLEINKLMDDITGKPEENVLQTLAIRSMAKAKYTTKATGHFGLAFQHYTHFTSPIRRYPDMMVHRLLQHYLEQGKPVGKRLVEEKCSHASEQEKQAANAERASIKYKQIEFMSQARDVPYHGIITGVADFGIFVEISETKCEGMVRLNDLKDDFYEYDERRFRVIGRRRRKVYRLGDEVVVRIKKTDVDRRLMDLTFTEEDSWS